MPDYIFVPIGHKTKLPNKKLELKRWLSLQRAALPTTTTRSLAPFARGAIGKSAVFPACRQAGLFLSLRQHKERN